MSAEATITRTAEKPVEKKPSDTPPLDIKQVLQKSTSEVAVSELTKKGFKQVKVLNQAMITRLIAEAVDRAINTRFQEITHSEREKVIEESKAQFEIVMRERAQKEREEIEKIRQENEEIIRGRSQQLIQLEAERDTARQRVEELERSLAEILAQVEEASRAAQADQEKLEQILEELKQKEEEVQELAEKLQRRDGEVEELKKDLEEAAREEKPSAMEGLIAALLEKLKEDPAAGASGSELSTLQSSIEGLVEKVSRLGSGKSDSSIEVVDKEAIIEKLFSKDGGEKLETNVTDVKVKEAKAGGVKKTLAKLKSLQKGGQKDGE